MDLCKEAFSYQVGTPPDTNLLLLNYNGGMRLRNKLTEYVYDLYDKGLMSRYSEEHFILRAMRGELNIIDEYIDILGEEINPYSQTDFCLSFLSNLCIKLQKLAKVFPEEEINKFIEHQLSAGKENYIEHQFFEALSEINILIYLGTYIGRIKEAIYQPELNGTGSNPEARFKFENGIIIDVEVKMGNFTGSDISKIGNGVIKPNILLTQNTRCKIQNFCKENRLQLIFPRALKIKDFIKSASGKFESPKTDKHFNLLFINWTYTDFPKNKLNEPISILINTNNGLFYNNEGLKLIDISIQERDRISAIILYRDTFDSLLTCDFRYSFSSLSHKYIINQRFNSRLDYPTLNNVLGMKPCNNGFAVEWYPYDFIFFENSPKNLPKKCNAFIRPLLAPYVLKSFDERY